MSLAASELSESRSRIRRFLTAWAHLWLGIALLAALCPQTARAAFISLDVTPTGNELEFNVQDFLNAESGFSLVKVDEPAPIALLGLVLVGCALVRGERRQVARRF